MWCIEPVLGLGFAEPPDYFLQGYNRFPDTARTLEAGRNWAQAFPRLPVGKYIGIASAALKKTNFEPDLVILYCDSSQLAELLRAVNCVDGHDIRCTMSGHAACVYSVVSVLKSGDYQVTSPCLGDYKRAMARDYEMIFTVAVDKLADLMSGLRYMYDQGIGFPRMIPMVQEYELPESYAKIRQMLGYEE